MPGKQEVVQLRRPFCSRKIIAAYQRTVNEYYDDSVIKGDLASAIVTAI